MSTPSTVFLSLPITSNLDPHGRFRADRRAFYSRVVQHLSSFGLDVLSAVVNENWGEIKLSPREFTRYDIDSIKQCDWLLVVASEPVGLDIYLEIGCAISRDIPVSLVVSRKHEPTYMIQGLAELGALSLSQYDAEEEAFPLLASAYSYYAKGNTD